MKIFMEKAYEKIAKILRADKDTLYQLEEKLTKITGRKKVMEKIVNLNQEIIANRLKRLSLPPSASAKKIYNALIKKIERDDKSLSKIFKNSKNFDYKDYCLITQRVLRHFPERKGFFLKREKFIELLEKTPPQKILNTLGYKSVKEMMKNENLSEIASALRFVEGTSWLNSVFLNSYKNLKSSDFEFRSIEVISLSPKWEKLARKFEKKKYHNISHLKELGIIFIIPISLKISGELTRTVALLFHYLNEVKFYSQIFERISQKPYFSKNLISLIKGEVINERKKLKKGDWLIIQRYLAKDDENDWRLFEPHINPEAIHWEKAEKDIVSLSSSYGLKDDFEFWSGLNWVGDYFSTKTSAESLVSFNLIDNSMSLVKKKEMIKYLYHHQESLWNKIFSSYLGNKKVEEIAKENIIKGYFHL